MTVFATMSRLCLFLIFFLYTSISAQVPNGGFEYWTNGYPDSCHTANIAIVPQSVMPDSNSHTGFLSIRGSVVYDNHNQPFQPYLSMDGGTAVGFPIAYSFSQVMGWIKLSLMPGDKFLVYVHFYDSDLESVADGFVSIDTSSINWTSFFVNMHYTSVDPPVRCTIYITISDSTQLVSGQVGSYFVLDDLVLTGTVDVMHTSLTHEHNIYPNPSAREQIVSIIGLNDFSDYSIYSLQGNIVDSGRLLQNEFSIPANMAAGIYIVELFSEDKRFLKKLIVR